MESSESQNFSPEQSSTIPEISEAEVSDFPQDSTEDSSFPNKIKRWWPFLLGFLLLLGGGFMAWRFLLNNNAPPSAEAGQPQVNPVKLAPVETKTIEESSEFNGILEAQKGVVLRAESPGRVTQIYASSGDRVTAGTPILQLKPDRSRAELSSAIANINANRAARNNAQAQIAAVEAQRASAQAELELQNKELERTSSLVSEGALARQELDRVTTNRASAIAARNAADEQIKAAKANLDQADADITQAEADAAVAREDLQDTTVVAPITGVVGDIPTKLGDYASAGDALTTITQNESLELEIAVPIEQENQLKVGLPVELTTSSEDDFPIRGRISFISPQASSNTQGVLAKARFDNVGGILRDQQKVRARIIWEQRLGVMIPTTAVSPLAGQDFVFVAVEEKNKQGETQLIAKQKAVKLNKKQVQENYYPVLEGLAKGETLIVSGLQNLRDGAPIKPQSAENESK
ncbi:MAG: efflux RND transporter periplasmic adaptor subunit [Spirulinaceae cyanobacterium]